MISFVNRIVSLVDERREERREEEDVGAAGRVGAGSRAGHGDGDAAGGPRGGREAVLLDLDVGAGGAVDYALQLGELVDLEALQSQVQGRFETGHVVDYLLLSTITVFIQLLTRWTLNGTSYFYGNKMKVHLGGGHPVQKERSIPTSIASLSLLSLLRHSMSMIIWKGRISL